MQTVWQDVRYGIRMLLKSPGSTLVAVLTLALGIGANTAIFSVLNAVLLRPFTYQEVNQLVMFHFTNSKGEETWYSTAAGYHNLRAQNTVFTDVAAWGNGTWPANLTGDREPERLLGLQVSANFFAVLGVGAMQGRTFVDEEDTVNGSPVVILSHDFWQREFGSDPDIIGRSMALNGRPYQIIGVMPADFRFVLNTDLWTPLVYSAGDALHQAGRLRAGVQIESARAEVESLSLPYGINPNSDLRADVKPLQTVLMGAVTEPLLILYAAVGFVLLIACVNVANLLLARGAIRRKEMAIRASLGAGRWRVVRQLLVESAILAVLGGACGLLLANRGIGFLVGGLPDWVAAKSWSVATLTIDRWALGYTLGLALLTTMVFGLIPALQASKVNLTEALKERAGTDLPSQRRLRSSLVVIEIALAMILLTGAGLMIKSLWRLNHVPRGFESAGALVAQIDPAGERYRKPTDVASFYSRLLERVFAIPGVQHAGIINSWDQGWRGVVEEHPPVPEEQRPWASRHPVSPDYFRAMGVPLKAGRFFTDRDSLGAAPVAIINEPFAEQHFPGENPIGQHLRFPDALREIVGVVGATRAWKAYSSDSDDGPPVPHVYMPYAQQAYRSAMTLVVRAQSGNPLALIQPIRDAAAAVDRDQPVHSFKLLEESVEFLRAYRRFLTLLLTVLAGLAALLAAVGIYGVMSYTVAERTHEIGIRMALGASGRNIIKTSVGHGLALVVVGLAAGSLGALGLVRYIRTLLFNVASTDATTYVAVPLVLAAVALLACYVPAKRAIRVDPMVALRHD